MNWINKLLNFWNGSMRMPSKPQLNEKTIKWSCINRKTSIYLNNRLNELGYTKILKREIPSIKETRWIFKVVAGIDQGREYVAITKEIRVGRHPENLILLRDPKASRFHAIFHRKGSRLILEDLGSTNGTRVNGEFVIKKRAVFSGDQIKIGESIIRVSLEKN